MITEKNQNIKELIESFNHRVILKLNFILLWDKFFNFPLASFSLIKNTEKPLKNPTRKKERNVHIWSKVPGFDQVTMPSATTEG